MIRRAAIIVVIFAMALTAAAQIKIGDAAPNFKLAALDGRNVELAKYRGRVVLVNFWATWCTPCQTEMPRFITFQREFGTKDFQVIGVSMDDSPEAVKRFGAKMKTNYPIVMGTTKIAEAYGGVLGLPITLLVDREGRVAKRYEGVVDLDEMEHEIRKLLAR